MQASFDKNKLGTGQRAEYMKTIFGEEASSAAAVLMNAAQSGKLDKLTAAFKASDGKTEELVKVMQENLGGDFKEFQSAYEAVGTDLLTSRSPLYVNWCKPLPATCSNLISGSSEIKSSRRRWG